MIGRDRDQTTSGVHPILGAFLEWTLVEEVLGIVIDTPNSRSLEDVQRGFVDGQGFVADLVYFLEGDPGVSIWIKPHHSSGDVEVQPYEAIKTLRAIAKMPEEPASEEASEAEPTSTPNPA